MPPSVPHFACLFPLVFRVLPVPVPRFQRAAQLFQRALFEPGDIGSADAAFLRGFQLGQGLSAVKPIAQADDARFPLVETAVKVFPQAAAKLPTADLVGKILLRCHHVHKLKAVPLPVGVQRFGKADVARRLLSASEIHQDLILDTAARVGGKAHALIRLIGIDALDEPDVLKNWDKDGVGAAYKGRKATA